MTEDVAPLLDAIRQVFPASRFAPISAPELAAIRKQHPDVPDHYLSFLRTVGAGRLGTGNFMIYNGPCDPSSFFDGVVASGLAGVLFFGDDFSGWMAGFDTLNGWGLVGVDSSSPRPVPERAKTIGEFVALRVSDFRFE
ncbi:Uncharacterized protein OS=Pseudomonas synxantha BG33R GN=PseBG33_0190 PE=4 SV=1 [Gemmata massiliana]|uniref:Knr4/Smi1-like domain-containing protein n=1 Tax=Gemmata massiliana TaxID=1210884 RepID=A0A6P2CWA2_9BACT|nr:hypothetical protein [Gemmata massiliana]VTR93261.1 Uncharacterized protein OS=Pseudomonas synxantha BG33R GN=PseBG33_0190 PE=4 SV=1 [Gemmata massiliana]